MARQDSTASSPRGSSAVLTHPAGVVDVALWRQGHELWSEHQRSPHGARCICARPWPCTRWLAGEDAMTRAQQPDAVSRSWLVGVPSRWSA